MSENNKDGEFFPIPPKIEVEEPMETLPDLSLLNLAKGMTGFVLKLSPIVAIWDSFFAILTM